MNQNDNPYEILGVNQDATLAEIKKAYRQLALKNHPDKQTTDEDRERANALFAKISNAYQILSDEELRRNYDLRQRCGVKKNDTSPTTSPRPNRTRYYRVPKEEPQTGTRCSTSPPQTSTRTSYYCSTPSSTTYQSTTPEGVTFSFTSTGGKFDPNFDDPFEVFKKMFREEYGTDFDPKSMHESTPIQITRRKAQKPETSESTQNSRTPRRTARMKSTPQMFNTSRTTEPSEKSTSGFMKSVPLERDDDNGNNPVVSMRTSTQTISHPDGTRETITETVTIRADGSSETKQESSRQPKPSNISYKTTSSVPMRVQMKQIPTTFRTVSSGKPRMKRVIMTSSSN